MRTKVIVRRLALALTMVGTVWLVGVTSPHAATQGAVRGIGVNGSASSAASYTCTVDLLYSAVNGQSESYQKTFQLAAGETFVDDFSTPLREHVFTASASQQGGEVVFQIDYFSDVSTFDAVELDTSLTMRGNQKAESQSGRNRFFTSSPGGYTLSYTLDCLKN